MNNKRLFLSICAMLLVVVMLLATVACDFGNTEEDTTAAPETTTAPKQDNNDDDDADDATTPTETTAAANPGDEGDEYESDDDEDEETTPDSTTAPVVTAPVVTEPEETAPNKHINDGKTHTYNTYTALSPTNWNELTYQDNNDTQIMSYIGSNFFSFDFKYDANGKIVPGDFVIKYEAATKLEDVSANYVGDTWGVPAGGKGYAYKITLRNDLKWENGDPITAADFVYTMQQQLDPTFKNYRADSFYTGATTIVNAQNYAKQGESGWFAADGPYATYSEALDDKIIFAMGPASADMPAAASFRAAFGFPDSYNAAMTAAYIIANYLPNSAFTAETAAAMEGKTLAEIKADPTLKAAWEALIGFWQTEPDEELDFFVTNYTYPAVSFDQVGIFVGANEYEIVLVLAKPLNLLKEDGSLSYQAAYNMASLPLVHKATYEANKHEPVDGSTLWTSTYNSSKETTMSWGPYKLESFQAGKQYVIVRNENWYGYNLKSYENLYQTDRIVCDTIEEWNSAWVKFLAGEIDGIGIDVTVADDYKGSARAYFTPDDFVASLQLQSSEEQLAARQEAGVNKTILANVKFRQALSLSIDRADFAKKTTTSSLAGFGLFNSMHYYDVENGGAYRNTDYAKQVLCDIYNVNVEDFDSLDAAVEAITGYDVTAARQLLTEAYNEELAAGKISATDKVVLTMGSGAINETVQRRFDYITAAWTALTVGTPLEGRFETEVKDFGSAWSNDFRSGKYDVCMGGWTGAAWDPGYFLLAYLSPDYMYSAAWDTSSVTMTFTMKGVNEDGTDVTATMSLMDWYDCLNGSDGAAYNWSASALSQEQRLPLIAALEKEVLKVYYSVPLYNNFSASLLSYKVDYITYEYNTFMGYGGMKYMTYNYDDAAWTAFVASNGGELNYK